MNEESVKLRLVPLVKTLAQDKRDEIERLKLGYEELGRDDFVWHFLLQSFATMGRAAGWHGLIGNKENYNRLAFGRLASLVREARKQEIQEVCRTAGVRMPNRKADYILRCFEHITNLGGLSAVKHQLLAQNGRDAKIRFLRQFPGIGPKYARNIMMDVYHEDFRDSIAIDVRIKAISTALGLRFQSYEEHENFYLDIAQKAGLNGWELDRLLFNFRDEIEERLRAKNT